MVCMLRDNDAGQGIEHLKRYHQPNFRKLHVLSWIQVLAGNEKGQARKAKR